MMHQKARDGLFEDIRKATPERRDYYLDLYLKWRDGVTEWDADQWGFDPDTWMWVERQLMDKM